MKPLRVRHEPLEDSLVEAIRTRLLAEGWTLVEKTHGNKYQKGWPDLYCFKPGRGECYRHGYLGEQGGPCEDSYGRLTGGDWCGPERHVWIEVKRAKRGRLTDDQRARIPRWAQAGLGVYVLTGAQDVPLLNGPANWRPWMDGTAGARRK